MTLKTTPPSRLARLLLLAALIAAVILPLGAAEIPAALRLPHPEYGFVSERPATHWQNSLITGNGTLGALIPGQPNADAIVLSHEKLFLPMYPPRPYLPVYKYMDKIKELIWEGKGAEANDYLLEVAKQYGFKGIIFTNPLIPASVLQFKTPDLEEPPAYARAVNFETGEATVAWKNSHGVYHRRMFVSRPDNVIVMQLKSPSGSKVSASFRLEQLSEQGDNPRNTQRIGQAQKTVASASAAADGEWITYVTEFERLWPEALGGYGVAARILPKGGTMTTLNGAVNVTGADEILLIARVELFQGFDPNGVEKLKKSLSRLTTDYDSLLRPHAKIHGELFRRVDLRLGDSSERKRTAEELIASSKVGATNPSLVEKLFEAARYNIISSTGELPATLQGIWGGTWRPAWSSDFTQDGNVQAAIAMGLNCNYPETTRAYLDYMSGLIDDFRANAKGLFNMRGLWVPSRTSDHGQVLHFARFPGLFWYAGAGWVSQFYYDYWLHTRDREFLEKQALPFMLDSAAFYEDFLTEERDGKYVFIPSYSPEITPQGHPSDVVINATMDVAVVKELLRNLLALSQEIELDRNRINRWTEILAKLPDYEIDSQGRLKEWIWPGLENNDEHRHASHLYPLYAGVDPDFLARPVLRQAAAKAIDSRLHYRRTRNGAVMAFGLALKGLAAAHIQDERLAYECLEWMANSFWTNALVSLHNPKRLFNLDISGGMPAVIAELLMQSTAADEIHLLPVLPRQWKNGSVQGLRARGGFEVDLTWKNGVLASANVTSLLGRPCKVTYGNKTIELETEKGESYDVSAKLVP